MSETGRTRSVLRAIVNGLLAGVLAVIIVIGLAAIVVPAVSGSVPLTVMTSSMEPSLPPGTLIVVRPTDPAEIKPGDVLTYQLRSGEPTVVTHRVLQQQRTADGEYFFITKGDANPTPDPDPVRAIQVRGTMWYAIPWVGWVAQAVTGDVRAVVVPIVISGLLIYALWMFVSGVRDRRRKASEARDQPVEAREAEPAAEAGIGLDASSQSVAGGLTRREIRESRDN